MFDLKISGLVGAKALMQNGWPTRVISLVSPHVLASTGPHHRVVEFDDIEVPVANATPPNAAIIRDVMDFSETFAERDRVLIHCHQGMRRSTAAAIGVMIQHGMGIREAFDHCYAIRPIMMPNRWVLHLIDDALKLNGELALYGNQWIADRLNADQQRRVAPISCPEEDHTAGVNEMERILRLLR